MPEQISETFVDDNGVKYIRREGHIAVEVLLCPNNHRLESPLKHLVDMALYRNLRCPQCDAPFVSRVVETVLRVFLIRLGPVTRDHPSQFEHHMHH